MKKHDLSPSVARLGQRSIFPVLTRHSTQKLRRHAERKQMMNARLPGLEDSDCHIQRSLYKCPTCRATFSAFCTTRERTHFSLFLRQLPTIRPHVSNRALATAPLFPPVNRKFLQQRDKPQYNITCRTATHDHFALRLLLTSFHTICKAMTG